LEEPTARIAICQIAHCDRIGSSWQRLARMLGLPEDVELRHRARITCANMQRVFKCADG
jgi:hypothetical protein